MATVHHRNSHHSLALRLIPQPRHTGSPRGRGGWWWSAEKSTRAKKMFSAHIETARTAHRTAHTVCACP